MGYPGDGWPAPYGEPPASTPPGQYGEDDPNRPGAAGVPAPEDGFDPDATRIERAPQYGSGQQSPYGAPFPSAPQPPYGSGPQPGYGSGQQPAYGSGQQTPYGSGQQPVYGSGAQSPYAPPNPNGPYGPPPEPAPGFPPAAPFGAPTGYPPSGPQAPQDPAAWSAPPPGGGFGGPPGPPYGPPPGKSGGKKAGLIIGGIVGAVVILGGGGAAVAIAANSGDDPPAPKPTNTGAQPTASSPVPTKPTPTTSTGSGRWLKIASRSTDPKPLTSAELFSSSRVSAHGRSYHRVIRKASANCAATVNGSRISKAETTGRCNQILRATFLRGDGKVMGTVSISNLATYAAARRAFEAAAGGQQYVTPLRGTSGRTTRLGRGAALGVRQVRGHYLILSWVQYADGHKPTNTAGRKQLSSFHSDVVSTTLARPLSYRMITGRPRS